MDQAPEPEAQQVGRIELPRATSASKTVGRDGRIAGSQLGGEPLQSVTLREAE